MTQAASSHSDSTAFVAVEKLTKRFGSVVAVNNVDLTLSRGETLAIIGPSAAGKSVLMKCLVGIYGADEGAIYLDQDDVSDTNAPERPKWAAKIGMLFQQNALFDSLTVWENICFRQIELGTLSRKAAKERAVELLGLVGLAEESAELTPSDLSGGMQKRVGIARAISTDPELLLLDNPTAGLDPVLSNHIELMISKIATQRGTTVISITNDMQIARTRYQNLMMMHDGKVYWSGKTDDIDDAHNAHLTQMLDGSSQGPITMRTGKREDGIFA
ncbi:MULTISPECIES: ABC transporter ATP-binding protein [Thalassospira]|uniref:ABC transporter ATP-binding protein n=1 Tax=Thalassospira TaxID=168934 RepID=UPI000DEDFB8B|nr:MULTISPECIES: ATP-binding cassette domain-containing protein [Thalassospira]MBO6771198.1 ATP-binding cassette domain-containing protein [Thalassospira sp.]MCC4240564.1 ATP-binding cassette domain-containing protein [Thalassospira povalilytica]RCK27077.1 organic solvent ABC transporter [Thalassospira profundimaris]